MSDIERFAEEVREVSGNAWSNVDVSNVLAYVRGVPQGTESRVCDDICDRQALGINKYKTTVEQSTASLRDWLKHAYEECLDQAVYLRRAIEELDKKKE